MNKLLVILFVAVMAFGGIGTATSADKAIEALQEHRVLEKEIRLARLRYQADLNKARNSDDADSFFKVLEKKGIRDLLRKLPPPVPPSVAFFSYHWPDPYPEPPEPGGWFPEIDREWLLKVERFRQQYNFAQVCDSTQNLVLESAEYIDAGEEGSASGTQTGSKSASVTASAGQSTAGHPLISSAMRGFRTVFTVSEGDNPTVEIISSLNSSFGWVEANTHGTWGGNGGGGYAKVSAKAFLTVSANNQVISPGPATIVSGGVSGQDQLYHPSVPGVGTEKSVRINLPTGGPYEIVVEELVELTAEASDGHAFINGGFTWDPLSVVIHEGCHRVRSKYKGGFPYSLYE